MRGRKVFYNGDDTTRPMKQKTREAVFSLLGGKMPNTYAMDLFGGTGILAMEAVSRGSVAAIILEMFRPAVSTILKSLAHLEIDDCVRVHNVDTLRWLKGFQLHTSEFEDLPWIVFCCPPYKLWATAGEQLSQGIVNLFEASPQGSQFVCEFDRQFDIQESIPTIDWDVRNYAPAYIAVAQK